MKHPDNAGNIYVEWQIRMGSIDVQSLNHEGKYLNRRYLKDIITVISAFSSSQKFWVVRSKPKENPGTDHACKYLRC